MNWNFCIHCRQKFQHTHSNSKVFQDTAFHSSHSWRWLLVKKSLRHPKKHLAQQDKKPFFSDIWSKENTMPSDGIPAERSSNCSSLTVSNSKMNCGVPNIKTNKLFTNIHKKKFLNLGFCVFSNSVRLHNWTNGVHGMTVTGTNLFHTLVQRWQLKNHAYQRTNWEMYIAIFACCVVKAIRTK